MALEPSRALPVAILASTLSPALIFTLTNAASFPAPMAANKPIIVIVSGAWHVSESYAKLTAALKKAGHDIEVPRLPSMNLARPPTASLASDTEFIRNFVKDLVDQGRNIVALMHSYGGQVGTNALYGLQADNKKKGGVSQLIYMSAFAQPEGWSMIDKVEEFSQGDLIPLAFDFADDKTVVSRDYKMLLVGDTTLPAAEVDAYIGSLVRWNGQGMYDRIENAAWRDVPTISYIQTTQDMTVPLVYQQSMVEVMRKAGREVRIVEIETGHCPNFTTTSEVVAAVNKFLS
jgi:pimeloyl-ACP methyl ester carboxylesterase